MQARVRPMLHAALLSGLALGVGSVPEKATASAPVLGNVTIEAVASEGRTTDNSGSIQWTHGASANYFSPPGASGQVETVSLPAGSVAGGSLSRDADDLSINLFATASNPCQLHCGATAKSSFTALVTLDPGWYRVSATTTASQPLDPDPFSTEASFSWSISGGVTLWSMRANDTSTTSQVLFLPREDYSLQGFVQSHSDRFGGMVALTSSLTIMPIPEPETWAMMSIGLLALALRRRRRGPSGVLSMSKEPAFKASTLYRKLAAIAIAAIAFHASHVGAQTLSVGQLQLDAKASEFIDSGGAALHSYGVASSFNSISGQLGDATTTPLPHGSRATVGVLSWGDGWQLVSQQTAQLTVSDPHSGAGASTMARVFFSIGQPGVYRLSVDANPPTNAISPGGGSSYSFMFDLSGSSGPSADFSVFELTTSETLHWLDARFLPAGDYSVNMSTALELSARFDATISATSRFAISPIPETSTVGLLLSGLVFIAFVRRRQHR